MHFASTKAGALLPLGFLSPLPVKDEDKPETGLRRAIRLSYQVVAMLSLMSELVSVMWATVAVNQLTETQVAPAESVW
jgi:cobalamin synthase